MTPLDLLRKEETSALLRKLNLTGRVIKPQEPGFDTARAFFYGSIDKRPAAIVRAANEADVSRVVLFARENGVELAVRSGGHSLAGHSGSEGGIVLDLSEMRRIDIDPEKCTATAQTGMTTGQFTTATASHGLAVGFGDSGTVGIGGITLGGGVGYLVRKHGLTIDSVIGADVVTADGKVLHVDTEGHPDLFWAIRGGGGNFGVVTQFTYRLQRLGQILGGILILPASADVLQLIVAEAGAAPEELSIIANTMRMPPMPFIPKDHHGSLGVVLMMVYAGEIEAGQRVVAPFRKLARPIVDMIRPMQYTQIYDVEGPHPSAMAVRNLFIDDVDRKTAQTIIDHLQVSTAPMAATQIRVLGGAMARVPADATAFAHRKRRIMVNVAAMYEKREETEAHVAWAVRFASELRQGDPGAYVNFIGDEEPARLHEAYPGSTWDRLAAIKARYDPDNLFHRNHNVPPMRG